MLIDRSELLAPFSVWVLRLASLAIFFLILNYAGVVVPLTDELLFLLF